MKEEIKKQIRELLDIRDENNFSDIELFKLLDKKRKAIHPERTTDEEVKKEYDEKFKKINELYNKFGEYIKIESNNNSIQLYNNEIDFDYVSVKIENDQLKETIKSLENKIDSLKTELEKKDTTIANLNDSRIKEETEKLKDSFKPRKSSIIVLGISALLGILFHILSQTEQAVALYLKYLPIKDPQVINYITFIILLIITSIFSISYFKKNIVNKWTEITKSTEFLIKLFEYVKENKEPRKVNDYDYIYSSLTYKFKERIVYNFIASYFKPKSKFSYFFRKTIGLNESFIFENLKNITIYGLINKEIIKITGNSGFDKILSYEE